MTTENRDHPNAVRRLAILRTLYEARQQAVGWHGRTCAELGFGMDPPTLFGLGVLKEMGLIELDTGGRYLAITAAGVLAYEAAEGGPTCATPSAGILESLTPEGYAAYLRNPAAPLSTKKALSPCEQA